MADIDPRRKLSLYIAHLIEDEIAIRGKGAWRPLGVDWDVSHATLQGICKDLKNIGPEVEPKLAARLAGGKRDVLAERAAEWWAKNPGWLPEKYRIAHPGKGPIPNLAWKWWPSAAQRAARKFPEWDWAIDAAGHQPQGSEPRENKRVEHVVDTAKLILNLPEEQQQELENRYRRAHPKARRARPRNPSTRPRGATRAPATR